MASLVRIEYRGILGDLPVGSTVTVEKCEAGVLLVRQVIPAVPPKPLVTKSKAKESDDAR